MKKLPECVFFGTFRQPEKNSGAGKTISRVLSLDSHSSSRNIAVAVKQPTRTLGEQRHRVLFGLATNGV